MKRITKPWTLKEIEILCENGHKGIKELRVLLPERSYRAIVCKSGVLGNQIKRGLYKDRVIKTETREQRLLRIRNIESGNYWQNESELEKSFGPKYSADELTGQELEMITN